MTAHEVIIRTAVKDKIEADKSGYVFSSFTTEETYFPSNDLEDFAESALKVRTVAIGFGSERTRELRNSNVVLLDLPVQIYIQKRVDPRDTSAIDDLVELVEQMMNSLEDDELVTGESYNWTRTEPLKDENELIYSYETLMVNGVFQSIFTVFYQYIKET